MLKIPPNGQEMESPSRMMRENRGLFWLVAGPSVFLSRADGDVRELLSCPNSVKENFGVHDRWWVFRDTTVGKDLSLC